MDTRSLLVLALLCTAAAAHHYYQRSCPTSYVYGACTFQPDPKAPVSVQGSVDIRQTVDCRGRYGRTEYWVRASGLPQTASSTERGMHVHQYADFSNGCASAGPHFNPFQRNHGDITSTERHVGDLGNVVTAPDGSINTVVTDFTSGLVGPVPVFGRAIVLHANRDDLGQGGDDESLKTGNAGQRYACCVIGHADGSRWEGRQ